MKQSLKDINLIVIHCSATRENQEYTFEQLKKDHKARGFNTCGYHIYIRKDGTIHQGRPFSTVGAHVADHNKNSIGICYEGGYSVMMKPKDTRTEEQKDELVFTLLTLINAIKSAGGDIKQLRITGHRDLSPDLDKDGVVEPNEWVKSCPCFYAEEEYKDLVKTL